MNGDGLHVTTIIVTYRRPEVLEATLEAVRRQTRPADLIVVVDNDPAGSASAVITDDLVYVAAPSNDGYAAGVALGMTSVIEADAYWILDDDSAPAANSLAIVAAELRQGIGVVANRGGHFRFGRLDYDLRNPPSGSVCDADFALIDGALVRAECVKSVGLPRADFFMMMEDFEFTTRIKAAGFRVVVVGGDQSIHQHLGSGAPWRGYYQARNHLRICIERRSLRLLFGWVSREVATQGHLLRRFDKTRLALRWAGIRDGLLGRMGRRHDL